jgi:hypothetical protein
VPSVVEQPEGQQPEQPTELRPEAVDEVLGHLRAAQEGARSVGDILRDALAADDALIAEATNGSADGIGTTTGSAGGVGANRPAEVAGDGSDVSGQAR